MNKYYTKSKGKNEGIICTLCPHFCLLKEGEIGKCFVRQAKQDIIFLSTYGCLTHIVVEPIEKKPFLHFLNGTKTLSAGGIGCNMFCSMCENFKYTQPGDFQFKFNSLNYKTDDKVDGKIYPPKDIIQMAKREKCSSICMTYNEPIISYEFLMDLAKECHKNSLKFVIKTNAYVNYKPWEDICSVIDAVSVDWKGTEKNYKEFGADKYVIEDRIKEAYEKGVYLEISIPLHYNLTKNLSVFGEFGKFLSSIDKKIPVHLLKIYPANRDEAYPTTSDAFISIVKSALSFYLDNIHIFI